MQYYYTLFVLIIAFLCKEDSTSLKQVGLWASV